MGHSQAEKAETHQRIVATASKKFRENGLDGIGVSDLMKAAGTTAGGFYKHFESRDDLVAEAVGAAFGAFDARVKEGFAKNRPVTLQHLLTEYLEVEHRDNPGEGCPFVALSSDLARSDRRTRSIATVQLAHTLELLTNLLGGGTAARTDAIVAYSAMIGAVGLARLANDDALSREILTRTHSALTQLTSAKKKRSAARRD
jgi:TetR/AcrR family transcriptional repressor of nem operon